MSGSERDSERKEGERKRPERSDGDRWRRKERCLKKRLCRKCTVQDRSTDKDTVKSDLVDNIDNPNTMECI